MSRVKLKDVVMRVKDKVDKDNTELEFYVGGEHIDGNEICVTRKGTIQGSTIGPAFHMAFKAGDVLLMSRNPHLRKASMVDFDGICSDVSYICRTKDEGVLLQSYLPFLLQSDDFWRFAEENKKGGLPFFLNWSDFERYEFELPSIEKQRELSDLLWSMQRTKQAYQELLVKTDELVKSQFIEMSALWENEYSYEPLSSYMDRITYGFTNPMPDTYEGPWKVTAKDIIDGKIAFSSARKTSQSEFNKLTAKSKPKINDVLLTKDGTLGRVAVVDCDNICINQSVALISCNNKIIPQFLASLLQMPLYQEKLLADAGGTTVKHLYITKVDKMTICVPAKTDQKRWLELVEQTDKSKFELKQNIENINTLMKSLMRQDFNS